MFRAMWGLRFGQCGLGFRDGYYRLGYMVISRGLQGVHTGTFYRSTLRNAFICSSWAIKRWVPTTMIPAASGKSYFSDEDFQMSTVKACISCEATCPTLCSSL